jgi:hypothetical protein
MTRARDVSRLVTTPPDIYATDSETSSAGYLTNASASSSYLTQASASTIYKGSNFRNLIINGAMQIAQRGTSTASITTDGFYTADRWNVNIGTLGTWTQSVENDAPTGSGFRKSLKMLCTTADASPAASDLLVVRQKFEGQNLQQIAKGTSSAKELTVSFWVKSNVTGTYIAELYDHDNTRQVSKSYTISASATWEKKTLTFPADTTGALDNDNALSFQIGFWLGAGTTFTSGTLNTSWNSVTAANRVVGQTNLAASTNNYWQVTGVQLEVGDTATPYEFKPIDAELAQCKRYYHKSTGNDGFGTPGTTTQATMKLPLPVPMRATPTVTFGASIGTTDPLVATKTGSSVVAYATSLNEVGFYMGGFSGFTIGVFTWWNGSPIECSA